MTYDEYRERIGLKKPNPDAPLGDITPSRRERQMSNKDRQPEKPAVQTVINTPTGKED